MKVDRLNGFKVITADAHTLGEVEGVHADTNTWAITHLEVGLTKEATNEFGFKKPLLGSLSVCLPITAVTQVGDVITLSQSLQALRNLRECQGE